MAFIKKLANYPYLLIIAVVIVSTFLLYLPFMTNTLGYLGFEGTNVNMQTVYQNYDGLLYVVPAKAGYNARNIENLRLEFPIPTEYYPAHLPVYPFLISIFAPLIGFLKSMLFVTLIGSMALATFFYYFVSKLKLSINPLYLTIAFLFLPRFLIVRSVGAPETFFLLFIISSVYFFEKKNYFLAGLLGGLSVMTKTPGILLAVAYGLVALETLIKEKKFNFQWFYLLLIPGGLLAVCYIYYLQTGNFFAYFNSGDNLHLETPFTIFNFYKKWIGTAWVEENLFYFFLYLYGIVSLKDTKYRSMFYFPFVFFTASIFVAHLDLARYMLPVWPFAAVAMAPFLTSKRFLIVLLLLFPAVYLYALNFMQFNIIPVADWRPFL